MKKKEVLFSDLAAAFGPSHAITALGDVDHWRSVPYRSGEICGTMLSALGDCRPEDISFDPGLTGWYRIYVCIPAMSEAEVWLRISADEGFMGLKPMAEPWVLNRLEEFSWRCCDMTGQKLFLSRRAMQLCKVRHSQLAWLRFVPMDEEEVARYVRGQQDPSHRCIYATDDIHNRLFRDVTSCPGVWDGVVNPYEDSDVQWLSLEDIAGFTGGRAPTGTPADYAFKRNGDRAVQVQAAGFDSVQVLSELVQKGKARGFQMSVSMRMGSWTMGFPYDQSYFDNDFFFQHPELCTVGRDGVPIPSLSYAFAQVQQYMISRLVTLAGTGCDAIALIAHRGGPYLQFEQPVADRFAEKYGFLPHTLPLDDERLNKVHCEIFTEFFRALRRALDEAFPERRVQVHLRTLVSVYDTRYVGLDCEELAKQGLIDAIISYPQRYRENLGESLKDGQVDLQAYTAFINSHEPGYLHQNDTELWNEECLDSCGRSRTPVGLARYVQEWMDIERNWGVPVYFDIMPRVMDPEVLRRRVLELYECGAVRFGLWDTYDRVPHRGMWEVARRIGHREELEAMRPPYYKNWRIHQICGMDISKNHPSWGG